MRLLYIIVILSSILFAREVKEYFANGDLKYSAFFENGFMQGYEKEWYSNGKIKYRRHYVDNELDGIYIAYHENGELKFILKYKKGIRLKSDIDYDYKIEKFYYQTN